MSQQRSLEQKRAAAAWDRIQAVSANKNEYCQAARGAMAEIQINGLGQALAFWNAKAKKESHYAQLRDDVSSWVMTQVEPSEKRGLLEWIVQSAGTDDYRRATSEAMAFLAWLKRFAEAELKV